MFNSSAPRSSLTSVNLSRTDVIANAKTWKICEITTRLCASRLHLIVINVILQGVYVASVSSNGCLSIHDFETLYCTSGGDSFNCDQSLSDAV